MLRVDLSTRERGDQVGATLHGELDAAYAAGAQAALSAAAAHDPWIVADLAGLAFIDCSGMAALARVREQARQAGGDLLLAAPQVQVRRLLFLTRQIDIFSVHDNVAQAAAAAGCSRRAAAPAAMPPVFLDGP